MVFSLRSSSVRFPEPPKRAQHILGKPIGLLRSPPQGYEVSIHRGLADSRAMCRKVLTYVAHREQHTPKLQDSVADVGIFHSFHHSEVRIDFCPASLSGQQISSAQLLT